MTNIEEIFQSNVIAINNIAAMIKEETSESITWFECLQIACLIQRNDIFEKAFVVWGEGPGALEKIAMELGASDSFNIKDAFYNIAQSIDNLKEK